MFITLCTHDIVCKLTRKKQKKVMKFYLIFNLLTLSLMTHASQPLGIESFKDIEHKNKGCPINSECSKDSGKLMAAWDKIFIHESSQKRLELMREFRKENGLPFEFLAKKEVKEKFDPILFNSRCKHHNPKNPHNNTYQGIMFFKKIPLEDGLLKFDKIVLFEKDKKRIYIVPYQDRPHFMKDDRLFFLKDYDDYFYQISLTDKGNYNIENLNISVFSKADSKKVKEVPCPENKEDKPDRYSSTYCQQIWDMDTNEMKTIQVFWSCP